MTINFQTASLKLTPFLLRFAESIQHAIPHRVRYDEMRQIAQVEINGKWVDTPDALKHTMNSTRTTRVFAETTDDA